MPVIMGHYWRWPTRVARADLANGNPDLFAGYEAQQSVGARRNVFCVDFSVGARCTERQKKGGGRFECRLAAVRWPERELVFDDGQRFKMK
jgi:hypothetical protein